MKIVIRAGILLIITTLSVSSETWKDDVRGWYIGIDETLDNACFMHSAFEDDTYLRVVLDSDLAGLIFVIGNQDWRSLEVGKLYPLEVQFGRRSPWTGDAEAFAWDEGGKYLALVIDSSVEERMFEFIEELQKMQNVSVRYNGEVIANLSLRGSFAAMNEVINCFFTINEGYRSTSSDPFSGNQEVSTDPFN